MRSRTIGQEVPFPTRHPYNSNRTIKRECVGDLETGDKSVSQTKLTIEIDYHKNNAMKSILHLPGSAAYNRQREVCVCMYVCVHMYTCACHTYTSIESHTWAKHVGGYTHTLKETQNPHSMHAACSSRNTRIKKP